MEEKKFERPELTIIFFEGDLATNDIIVVSGENSGGPEDEWWI